jgi:glycosyltransferase involved in cell wall biosynthesis
LSNVVANGKTGLLVPTNDLRALIDACRVLGSNVATCKAMGQAARIHAMDQFKGEDAIEKYVAIYKDVLS